MHAPAVDPKPQRGGRYVQLHVALIAALASSCNLDNQGDDPPAKQLYFTNALALSLPTVPEPDPNAPPPEPVPPRYLFAANSNYDLRYNAGTVVAIDLDDVVRLIDEGPGEDDETCGGPNVVCIDPAEVIEDEAFIGSYSTALGMAPDGRTLFVATRTDTSLAFIHVNPDAEGDRVFRCGPDDEGRECTLRATPTVSPTTNTELIWPPDPTSILARPLKDFLPPPELDAEGNPLAPEDERLAVLVSHLGGFVSLFTSEGDGYEYVDVLPPVGPGLTGIDFEPTSRLAYGSTAASVLSRIGVAVAAVGSPPVLYNASTIGLAASSIAIQARDLEFLPKTGTGLAAAQDNMLVVGQNPNSLSLVALDGQPRNGEPSRPLRVLRSAVVGFGAYRVATGKVGDDKPIALVSALDSREIHIIDLNTMLPLSVVPQLSGPFDIQYDEVRELLYVADYSSSVIRVLDLAPIAESDGRVPAQLVATIGEPRVIQELR